MPKITGMCELSHAVGSNSLSAKDKLFELNVMSCYRKIFPLDYKEIIAFIARGEAEFKTGVVALYLQIDSRIIPRDKLFIIQGGLEAQKILLCNSPSNRYFSLKLMIDLR